MPSRISRAPTLKFASRRGLKLRVCSPAVRRPDRLQRGRFIDGPKVFIAYQSEPVSRLATWSRNLAIFAVVAVVVSILIVRFGFLEMKPALATFFGALGLAALSILVGLAAFARIWQNGSRGMGRILLAFLISTLLLAYPAYLALQYRKLPKIYDVTTDPIDPPRFEALARLRSGEGTNSAVMPGLFGRTAAHRLSRDRDGGTRSAAAAGL